MKSLILATTLALAAPVAQAESFELYSKGAWSVSYETRNTGVYCVASVTGDGVYFSIDVGRNELDAWYINPDNDFGEGTKGIVDLWIDNHNTWETPAGGRYDTIRMWGLKEKFLTQIMNGRRLWLDQDGDGRWDAWFSLEGSSAAIWALIDCKNKL